MKTASNLINLHIGQFVGSNQVRFDRSFCAPVDSVWKYLTDETALPLWIADATVDLRVGGNIELRFREDDDPEGYCKGENVSGGKILQLVEQEKLVFEFCSPHAGRTLLTYLLVEENGETHLTLIHSDLPPDLMVAFAAGWHCYLTALGSRLANIEPEAFAPQFETKIKRYAVLLTLCSAATSGVPGEARSDNAAYATLSVERNEMLRKFDRLAKDEDDLNWQIQQKRIIDSREAEKDIDYLTRDLQRVQRDMDKLELDIRDNAKARL